ncbi:hypothetical protein LPB87_12670 [Flavobacterium sp. EDS]|uniref:hypothetical protein n=1 Tax=Flavobacterium sp. EDS TaxID=2897328 RepID=UPI001E303050|nr:hypothetical protein [Flavobacterium sp. EDS]MCD0475249.1 hypothetical protein [Flavobacterium sp. EDS]
MGVSIGAILVSYDVNKLHIDVKNAMKLLGYREQWNYPNEKSYNLPNTTLWHSSKSSNQGITDIKTVCLRLGVSLEKAIAVNATEFVGV